MTPQTNTIYVVIHEYEHEGSTIRGAFVDERDAIRLAKLLQRELVKEAKQFKWRIDSEHIFVQAFDGRWAGSQAHESDGFKSTMEGTR